MKTKILILLLIISLVILLNSNFTYQRYNLYIDELKSSIDAVLSIPKISFKQGINKDNKDVNIGLWLAKESIFPDSSPSNVIIAGHSGNASNAYFRNLYKLNIHDLIYFYYQKKVYLYEIFEITTEPKTGTLFIKETNNDIITLITCTKNDNFHQTIYYGLLKSVNNM